MMEVIPLDNTGAGSFHTAQEGEYGFLLSGNYRNKLRLSINGEQVFDIKNMWVPFSASGKMRLAANTTYNLKAETGGDAKLSMRAPSETMAFRSEMGRPLTITSFMALT